MGPLEVRPLQRLRVCQQGTTVLSRFQSLLYVSHGPGEKLSIAPALNSGLSGREGGCHQEMAWLLSDQRRDEPGTPNGIVR